MVFQEFLAQPAAIALIVSVTTALAISTLCSLFEAVLYSARISVLEAAREEGSHRASAEQFIRMKADIGPPTAAILILNTMAHTVGATVAGAYAAILFGEQWLFAFSAALTLAILYVSEIAPKTYGATHWNTLWRFIVWPLRFIEIALKPLIVVTERFSLLFSRGGGDPQITENEVLAMVRLGQKTGQISRTEQQLLSAIFSFDEMYARQIMIPRRDIQFMDASWTLDECIASARKTRHTRYPVCRGTLEEPIGFVHIKDLFGFTAGEPFNLAAVTRPLRYVTETARLSRLLREMQNRQHMALVVDEYGAVQGAVFLEDILEQIVGVVQDEFDFDQPSIVHEGPGRWIVAGILRLDRLNQELRLDLRHDEMETLSGLIMARMGRVPETGDVADLDGVRAEVLEMQGRRAGRVRLTVPPQNG